MSTWELVVEKMKELPPEKQEEILDFVEFVRVRAVSAAPADDQAAATGRRTALGSRLRAIRERIEASGEPLLDADGVLREVAERRGGVAAMEARGDADVR